MDVSSEAAALKMSLTELVESSVLAAKFPDVECELNISSPLSGDELTECSIHWSEEADAQVDDLLRQLGADTKFSSDLIIAACVALMRPAVRWWGDRPLDVTQHAKAGMTP
ncbi:MULTISPECIES: hypothetical protein [unclassified Streptomyces]|uniref:hypothetical protein n=1 Tax=unclassified Streptomyces TaxID=2593676 RepID=UPI001656049A|nr:hypothetical protein [Streptomyces sp. CB02980]MCB8902022.1 hypothetical protein [Streptomyces sp. CB02980]